MAKPKDIWLSDWSTVQQMNYKKIKKIFPEKFWNRYKTRNEHPGYITMCCMDIEIQRFNLKYSKKSRNYSSIRAWNDIPTSISGFSTRK